MTDADMLLGESSTFNALHVQADDGIGVSADITTTEGSFFMDGDVDNSPGSSGRITFDLGSTSSPTHRRRRADRTLKAKTELTLASMTGSARYECRVTLLAADGITILTDVTGIGNEALVLNADYETFGNGVLTVGANKKISSTNTVITVTAFDLDLQGSLDAGSSNLIITGSLNDEMVGIGDSIGHLNVDNEEMQRMTSQAGLSIGNDRTASISLNNVTNSASQEIGTLTLIATRPTYNITFAGSASTFNKGLVVEASQGLILSASVTTQGLTKMNAGTGTVTIEGSKALSTTNNLLILVASDFDIPGSIVSGNKSMHISTTTSKQISVGNYLTDAATLDASEFQHLHGAGLQIGLFGGPNTDVFVEDLDAAVTSNIVGICTFVATVDDSQITFRTAASTFHSLSAQADNGVTAQVDLHTTVGSIYLDGDFENSSTADTEAITLADDILMTAKEQIQLESHTGTMTMEGALTLSAGSGILITGTITQASQANVRQDPLVFFADNDGVGGGDFSVSANSTLQTDSNTITITALDIDLDGYMDTQITQQEVYVQSPASISGTELPTIQILGSQANITYALGDIAGDMHLSDEELGRMTTHGGLTIGGTSPLFDNDGNMHTPMVTVKGGIGGDIIAAGVTNNNTDTIGRLTLIAKTAGSQINFEQTSSTFNKVSKLLENCMFFGD